MANVVNIAALQREAKTYEALLQTLPFTTLMEPLTKLGIGLVDVKDKNVLVAFERKGGLTRPYAAGNPTDNPNVGEIGKVKERELAVEKCVLPFYENIDNYKGYTVVTGQMPVDNKEKKHPLERMILEEVVKTVTEDCIDAMFHAKRDTSDLTPMGMFDGLNEMIDAEIVTGEIAAAKGNYKATGTISLPASTSDTDAIDQVVDFVRAGHAKLKKNAILAIDPETLYFAIKALENKTINHSLVNFEALLNYVRSICLAPTLQIVSDECLGTGGRLIMYSPGNLEFGMKTQTDKDFVQVRNPYSDPNWVQFWCQFEAGTRIRSIHEKSFIVNDQTNTAVELSGDYRS